MHRYGRAYWIKKVVYMYIISNVNRVDVPYTRLTAYHTKWHIEHT